MVIHVNIKINGRVQGVGFRYHARKIASALGIAGIVRNEPDGSVYAEAEGEQVIVDQFIQWCRKGPSMAGVTDVIAEKGDYKGYDSFEIISGMYGS